VCIIAVAGKWARARIFLFNVAAVLAAIGLFELYLTVWPAPKALYGPTYSKKDYITKDAELGYAISPGPRVINVILKKSDGSAVYDVKYTIDEFGLRRISPNAAASKSDKAVFFFGDSFTFGEGVNDEDTLPQQFQNASGLRSINFGVHGYGPHHVLRELETCRSRSVENRDPLAVVYGILPSAHMFRAAGRAEWDQNGPRYEIIDGSLKDMGQFENGYDSTVWHKILSSSRIYNQLLDAKIRRANSNADRERVLAMISRMRDLSLSQYHAPFFVLLWNVPWEDEDAEWLRRKLQATDIPLLVLSTAAPELRSDKFFIPLDYHPKKDAYALVAAALNVFFENTLYSGITGASK
jgi:hypothetical protein